jgi:uncharacterized protein (TIGR02271 family)
MARMERAAAVGVFSDRDQAERAVDELRRQGFRDDQIGFAMRSGVGGVHAALVGMGIREDEASYYEAEFQAGRVIVTVEAEGRQSEASSILRRFGAYDAASRSAAAGTGAGMPEVPGYAPLGVSEGEAATLTEERTIELREEELVPRKELREVGRVQVRTEVEEVPGRLEVEALREEVEVEHVPVGEVVTERVKPWEEDGVVIVPIYEEQLVVVKRLFLREHLRIRRVATTETRLFADTLRRDKVVVEDPDNTGLVHERFPKAAPGAE